MDKIDTSKLSDSEMIMKSQQDFMDSLSHQARAVDKHGMPIDFWGDEPEPLSEETTGERLCLWITVLVMLCVIGFITIQ